MSLVGCDDFSEELVDAPTGGEHRGNHWHAEQFGQFLVVDVVASLLGFVEHVQCTNHAEMHVDELGSEIEIAFQI